ncbi:MAG: hypothetical protein MJ071_08875 [Oscillospiraceae bacterium]|nr:hypothetical protein [Oscillospiraceae bacterium]
MKKIISVLASVLVMGAALSVSSIAAETKTLDSADVYVTISDSEGKLVLIQQKVTVTDIDSDGVLTINDALYLAHENCYDGGASEGYGSGSSQYGLSLTKLWGTDNGGSYGYCVNNVFSMGLTDPVVSGDYLNAYVYTDLTTWSDAYSFFDANVKDAEIGEEVTLQLLAKGYDAAWNPVNAAVADAVITIDGEATEYRTDENGKVTMALKDAGKSVISAVSENMILVPPVCVVNVAAEVTTETTAAAGDTTTAATTTTTAAATTAAVSNKVNAAASKTGDAGVAAVAATMAVAAAVCFVSRKND